VLTDGLLQNEKRVGGRDTSRVVHIVVHITDTHVARRSPYGYTKHK